MKKIFLSIIATVIFSAVVVYADGGKKVVKKNAAKKECTKANCPNTTNCHKAVCPNKPGCICN